MAITTVRLVSILPSREKMKTKQRLEQTPLCMQKLSKLGVFFLS